MKKLLLIFLVLVPCVMLADGVLIFLLRTTSPAADRNVIREKFKNRFFDTSEVDVSELGQERLIANTNVIAWRLVVDLDQAAWFQKRSNLPTKAEFDAWKELNLQYPARFEVYYAADKNWRRELTEHGLEPVPESEPQP